MPSSPNVYSESCYMFILSNLKYDRERRNEQGERGALRNTTLINVKWVVIKV